MSENYAEVAAGVACGNQKLDTLIQAVSEGFRCQAEQVDWQRKYTEAAKALEISRTEVKKTKEELFEMQQLLQESESGRRKAIENFVAERELRHSLSQETVGLKGLAATIESVEKGLATKVEAIQSMLGTSLADLQEKMDQSKVRVTETKNELVSILDGLSHRLEAKSQEQFELLNGQLRPQLATLMENSKLSMEALEFPLTEPHNLAVEKLSVSGDFRDQSIADNIHSTIHRLVDKVFKCTMNPQVAVKNLHQIMKLQAYWSAFTFFYTAVLKPDAELVDIENNSDKSENENTCRCFTFAVGSRYKVLIYIVKKGRADSDKKTLDLLLNDDTLAYETTINSTV